MLELLLCSAFTILPDYLYRRYAQGRRFGYEITFYSVWYELRYGITACVILTILLITTVFFFHPSTTRAVSYYRTVPILTEIIGRVDEVYVELRDEVTAGQPLFKLESAVQEAAVVTAQRRVEEVTAFIQVALSRRDQVLGQITQAESSLEQAQDELDVRNELLARNSTAISDREVETMQNTVAARQAALDVVNASLATLDLELNVQYPAQRATAEAALAEAEAQLAKTVVTASMDGVLEQFTLRPGDLINPMIRPAGVLVPNNSGRVAIMAGFDQIESSVIRRGMIAEVLCPSKPYVIIPAYVSEVQDVIAAGQIRPTDVLIEPAAMPPGSVTVLVQPLYGDAFDGLPPGSSCEVNLYTSNYDRLHNDTSLGSFHKFGLHAIDTIGMVHAIILRMRAVVMPVKLLVLSGGH